MDYCNFHVVITTTNCRCELLVTTGVKIVFANHNFSRHCKCVRDVH